MAHVAWGWHWLLKKTLSFVALLWHFQLHKQLWPLVWIMNRLIVQLTIVNHEDWH